MAQPRPPAAVSRLVLLVLLAGAAAALLPRIALTFYAFPSTDDYCIVAGGGRLWRLRG